MITNEIRCRRCRWTTPAGLRRNKGGKVRDGWSRLARHFETAHADIEINQTALLATGPCDDRDFGGACLALPPPGVAPDSPARVIA